MKRTKLLYLKTSRHKLKSHLWYTSLMHKSYFLLVFGIVIIVIAGLLAIMSQSVRNSVEPPVQRACTDEAKICPDGSAVGRTGPNCEFSPCSTTGTGTTTYECDQDAMTCPDGSTVGRIGADCHFARCPAPGATSGTIQTTVGQKMTALNTTVTPLEVTSDSRCPTDVQCIWAGTVKVRTKVENASSSSMLELTLGSATSTLGVQLTLSDVSPSKTSGGSIPISSYRFIFTIKKI